MKKEEGYEFLEFSNQRKFEQFTFKGDPIPIPDVFKILNVFKTSGGQIGVSVCMKESGDESVESESDDYLSARLFLPKCDD